MFNEIKKDKTDELSMHFRSWKWATEQTQRNRKENNKSEGRNQWKRNNNNTQ